MLPAVLLVCLVALDGELGSWLERAGSADWAERERAQRWLATHLEPADAQVLAVRATSGDAELRARLARAIGGEPRLVELAAALALRAEPAASELGREALREQILEWDPGAENPGGESLAWLIELKLRCPERLRLPAELRAGEPAAILDLVARRADATPPLVLDPRASAAAVSAGSGELAGRLPELLLQCAAERGLRVQAFGFDPQEPAQAWLLLAQPESGSRSAGEWIADWVLAAADSSRAAAERAAAGRALAATGWPAALALLESRWRAADEAALDGLLLAAGRGRVAPALQEPARQRSLYTRLAALVADEANHPALARASSIARALGAAGPLSRGGESLGPLALEGFERAAPREQWLRLSVLEAQGRAFPEALAAADSVLASSASPAALAVEALRLRAALAGAVALPHPPAQPLALLDWAADARTRAELRALWSGLDLAWPAQWNGLEARGSALPAQTRGLLLELAWHTGTQAAVNAHARALCADRSPGAFDALVAALAHSDSRPLADLLPAGSPAEASRAAAAALLAGLAPSPRDEAELARWLDEGAQTGEQLLALASQAAGARGAAVRARLLVELGAKLPLEPKLAALERAARELSERGAEPELADFAGAARERARALGDAALRARLRPGRWPEAPGAPARDLGRDERELERW